MSRFRLLSSPDARPSTPDFDIAERSATGAKTERVALRRKTTGLQGGCAVPLAVNYKFP